VGKIQDLSNRLVRLEADYNDVRGPIKDLTKLVENVTKDLQEVKSISQQNTLNIKDLAESSRKTKESIDTHQGQLTGHGVEIRWIKWGVTALLGALAVYWLINAILPLLKHPSVP
jgi:chromosome segregation ATPase